MIKNRLNVLEMTAIRALIRKYKNLSLIWKFNVVYFIIIVIPITILGVYIYQITYQTIDLETQRSVNQELFQIKENILDKVRITEEFAKTLSNNSKLRAFLEEDYLYSADDVINLKTEILPYMDNIFAMKSSLYQSMTFYNENSTIPEVYDYFRSIDLLKGNPLLLNKINDSALSWWWETEDIYQDHTISFFVKIHSFSQNKLLAVLEIKIPEQILFDILGKSSPSHEGAIYVTDMNGIVISDPNDSMYRRSIAFIAEAEGMKPNQYKTYTEKIQNLDSNIVKIMPMAKINKSIAKVRTRMIVSLFSLIVILFFIASMINVLLLKKLKLLVTTMKQIKGGNMIANVPIESNDEVGELTRDFNRMIVRIDTLIEQVYKAKIAEKEADFKALEAQINPHFLYNTLASIAWVAKAYKNYKVVEMTNALAKFYRMTLDNQVVVISVGAELENLEAYLKIQSTRFPGMFDVFYDVAPELLDYQVIKLILQPLVENALNHGIEPKMDYGTIVIKARELGDDLILQVIDDGVGIPDEILRSIANNEQVKSKSGGYALKNVNDRIKIYYGQKYGVTVFSKRGIGTTVTITISKTKKVHA